jgi:cold shock CspA family protein/uncharacterized LabA/DUF88 family protein
MPSGDRLIRIGVFYDGNFFYHVSNYYHYNHPRGSRISISGLHKFIRQKVADSEGVDVRYSQIVDAHYFRGRMRAQYAEQRDLLLKERIFDDILIREGVTTHYLHLGPEGEKGIDVWLALEAFELSMYKHYDVLVLIACDGDFLPLIRKLNTIGTRVMLLAWDFRIRDQNDQERETRTAQALLDEANYPLLMHQIIDDRSQQKDQLINGLFVPKKDIQVRNLASFQDEDYGADGRLLGCIQNLKEGFGFLTPEGGGPTLFFHHTSVVNVDFSELLRGDVVSYELGRNEQGPCAVNIRVLDANRE